MTSSIKTRAEAIFKIFKTAKRPRPPKAGTKAFKEMSIEDAIRSMYEIHVLDEAGRYALRAICLYDSPNADTKQAAAALHEAEVAHAEYKWAKKAPAKEVAFKAMKDKAFRKMF
jgi:hypothetical protein